MSVVEELVEKISNLTLSDAAELKKALEDSKTCPNLALSGLNADKSFAFAEAIK